MGKVTIFIESDGWYNTLHFIWKAIRAQLPHTAHTYCLFADRNMSAALIHRPQWEEYTSKVITNQKEMESIHFGRLKLTPWRKWLEAGSRVIVLFRNTVPVAFGWIHFRSHTIQSVGTFNMETNIAWLGPSFVHINHRGKGLQQLVIQQCINNTPHQIDAFITSVNTGNVASLHSFEKCGFKKGLEVSYTSRKFTPPYKKCVNIKALDSQAYKYLKLHQ